MKLLLASLVLLAWAPAASAQELAAHEALAKEIYRELIEIRTVHPDGDNTAAARAVAKRLLDAGFDPKDVEVVEPAPLKGNLVARYRGTGELKPLLLLAHIDVVEARKEDWSDGLDPFRLTEKDGYFYGRGTYDDKAMAAIFVANLIRFREEGFRPKRDLIVALTADEETGTHNGVGWLLRHRRELIDAELALNEGGGGTWKGGKPLVQGVQVAEKMSLNFDFVAIDPGGHSSVPRKQNAIYQLAGALDRLKDFEFPVRINAVTRAYFGRMAEVEGGELGRAFSAVARDEATEAQLGEIGRVPRYNAVLRTTCVATKLEAGHALNALPQRATANVNCRLLPGEDAKFVHQELQRVAGTGVGVKARRSTRPSQPSDPEAPVMRTIARVSEGLWPGVPVVPLMGTGATDGSRLRNAGIAVYGASGLFVEFGDIRAHGRDERLAVRAFFDGQEFLYRLVKALGSGE